MMKTLPPLPKRPKNWEKIQARITDVLKKEIYLPLLQIIKQKKSILNSQEDLIHAISTGQIQYVLGHFEGEFNALVSKELRRLGAEWDRKQGWWKVPQSKLNPEILSAISASHSRFTHMASQVNDKLSKILPKEITDKLKLDKLVDTVIYEFDEDFRENIKHITLQPKLSEETKKRVREEYVKNLHLEIQDFTEKETEKLRRLVFHNVMKGNRYENLIKVITDSYDVSYNKAKFLARQETRLLTTKLQQTRYQQAGMDSYIWTCVKGSPQHAVRPSHKKLDGTIQRWDKPPFTDDGRHVNPGQDFGCRCTARPVVRF